MTRFTKQICLLLLISFFLEMVGSLLDVMIMFMTRKKENFLRHSCDLFDPDVCMASCMKLERYHNVS